MQGQRNKTVDVRAHVRGRTSNRPLVSCIMPTHNRRRFVPQAVQYFLRQDYPHRELIIVDDGTDTIRDLVPDTPPSMTAWTQSHHLPSATWPAARPGETVRHWDDDDWMAAWRITYQVDNLLKTQADICGLAQLRYMNQPRGKPGNTSILEEASRGWPVAPCVTQSLLAAACLSEYERGGRRPLCLAHQARKILALPDNTFYVALVHAGNTSPKRTADSRWQPVAVEEVWP